MLLPAQTMTRALTVWTATAHAAYMAVLGLVLCACDNGATGVDACRQIETARCEAVAQCPNFAWTPDDIDAITDKLDNGVWIVLHAGWSKFYFEGADFAADPFVNGFNYPGLNKAAIDRLIEIEDAKGIRINGILSEVLGVETGQNSRGEAARYGKLKFSGKRMPIMRAHPTATCE